MNRSVSILGCGWLGLPLGNLLCQAGFTVKGSTTTNEKLPVLAKAGITPYHLLFNPEAEKAPADFFNTEVLVITLPPQHAAWGPDFHLRQLRKIMEFLNDSRVERVIYISSTSVYPDNNTVVREMDVTRPSQAANTLLAESEALFNNLRGKQVTILRCAGLMGYDRIPGKYFAGKTVPYSGERKVNYIHRDDVVAITRKIITSGKAVGTFNLVAPLHPPLRAVYLKNSATFGFKPPVFSVSGHTSFKVVDGTRLTEELKYRYQYPDPLQFF